MMDWQPIKTAPKNGARVMLWCDFDRQEIVIWRWRSPITTWSGPHGPFTWATADGNGLIAERIPTHWMPLPEPPVCNASDPVTKRL
jgi:hypothetical protein